MFEPQKIYTPKSLQEAVDILANDSTIGIVGGGNSLFSASGSKEGLIVSLADIDELRCIFTDDGGNLVIGCSTTFTNLLESPVIRSLIPAVADSVRDIGLATFRNTATVGGNLCKSEGVRELTASLCAYEALIQLQKGDKQRLIPLFDLYDSTGKAMLEEGEILVAVIVEHSSLEGIFGSSYRYVTHNNPDNTLMCCSANVRLTTDGMRIEQLRLCYVSDNHPPRRLSEAEILAEGSGIFPADISPVTAAILHSVEPDNGRDSNHDFIVHLVRETAKSVITHSIELAKK